MATDLALVCLELLVLPSLARELGVLCRLQVQVWASQQKAGTLQMARVSAAFLLSLAAFLEAQLLRSAFVLHLPL